MRYVARTPALRKRRQALATRIRAIKADIHRGNCRHAERLLSDTVFLMETDAKWSSMKPSSLRSLRAAVVRCYRKYTR